MQILINPATIHAFDRLAHYGDGCFTTAAFSRSRVEYLNRHMERLHRDSQSIGLTIPSEAMEQLQSCLIRLAQEHDVGVLKVLVSSGLSERGYQRADTPELQAYVFILPPVARYVDWQNNGIQLGMTNVNITSSVSLARTKHANRLEQAMIKDAMPSGVDDVLVMNDAGHIVETSAANVFFRVGDCWFTPELDNGGIAGVMRNRVVNILHTKGVAVQEVTTGKRILNRTTDIFICNSLMRIVPVNTVIQSTEQQWSYDNACVAEIQGWINDDIEQAE